MISMWQKNILQMYTLFQIKKGTQNLKLNVMLFSQQVKKGLVMYAIV